MRERLNLDSFKKKGTKGNVVSFEEARLERDAEAHTLDEDAYATGDIEETTPTD